jgi:hypothetical protein
MATLSELRAGLSTNLATIAGLRTSATIPDSLNPPIAVVMPSTIRYDTAFARTGGDEFEFLVLVVVGRVDERSAQNKLDDYCSSSGAGSVKAAIETDKTLGGKAFSLRVTTLRSYSQLTVGDITYLSAEFVVQVFAQ